MSQDSKLLPGQRFKGTFQSAVVYGGPKLFVQRKSACGANILSCTTGRLKVRFHSSNSFRI